MCKWNCTSIGPSANLKCLNCGCCYCVHCLHGDAGKMPHLSQCARCGERPTAPPKAMKQDIVLPDEEGVVLPENIAPGEYCSAPRVEGEHRMRVSDFKGNYEGEHRMRVSDFMGQGHDDRHRRKRSAKHCDNGAVPQSNVEKDWFHAQPNFRGTSDVFSTTSSYTDVRSTTSSRADVLSTISSRAESENQDSPSPRAAPNLMNPPMHQLSKKDSRAQSDNQENASPRVSPNSLNPPVHQPSKKTSRLKTSTGARGYPPTPRRIFDTEGHGRASASSNISLLSPRSVTPNMSVPSSRGVVHMPPRAKIAPKTKNKKVTKIRPKQTPLERSLNGTPLAVILDSIYDVFTMYSGAKPTMDASTFAKLYKDCGLVAPDLRPVDVEEIFRMVVPKGQNRIGVIDFVSSLDLAAKKKTMDLNAVHNAVAVLGGPSLNCNVSDGVLAVPSNKLATNDR